MTSTMSKRIIQGVLAGWGGQFATIVLRVVLTPALFASLTKVEVGTWYLLGSTVSILQLAEFGMLTALTRRIGMAKGRVDLGSGEGARGQGWTEILELIEVGRVTFRWRAALALVVGLVGGSLYVLSLGLEPDVEQNALIAWGIFVFGHAMQIQFGYLNAVVMGLGLVVSGTMIGTVVTIVVLLMQIAVVSAGGGLVGLAFVAVGGPLAQKQLQLWHLRRSQPDLLTQRRPWNTSLFRSLLRPAMTTWLTTVSFFAIGRVDNFFITGHLGLQQVANYQPASQVSTTIQMAALMLANVSGYFISQTWGVGDTERIRRMVTTSTRFALFVLAAGMSLLVGMHEQLFLAWIGHSDIVATEVVIALSLKAALEGMISIYTGALRSVENDRSSFSYLIAAAINLPLTWLLVQQLGLLGVVVSTVVAQGVAVGPFALFEARRQFGLNLGSVLIVPLLEALLLFAASLLIVTRVREFSAAADRGEALMVVIAGAAAVAVALAVAVVTRVMSSAQRKAMLDRLRALPGRGNQS